MKKKYSVLIILILLILSIVIYVFLNNYIKANEQTAIIRIPEAGLYDLEYNKYEEYYIIVNPPKDVYELQQIIKEYDNEHSIEEENREEFEKYRNMYGSKDSTELQKSVALYKKYNIKIKDSVMKEITEGKIPHRYSRIFLQETKYLPRDWKPKGSYDITDDHINEQIAAVYHDYDSINKVYNAWEREDYKFFDEKRNRKIIDKLHVEE